MLPKLKTIFGILAVTLCLSCGGASYQPQTPAMNARAVARGFVESAETAWMVTAQACIDVAVATNDDKVKSDCADVMVPMRDVIVLMGTQVDSWTAVDQQNYACAMIDVVGGINKAIDLLGRVGYGRNKLPQVVQDTLDLAGMLNLSCGNPYSDAGAE